MDNQLDFIYYLVSEGYLTQDALEKSLQEKTEVLLMERFLKNGFLTEQALDRACRGFYGLGYVNLHQVVIEESAVQLLPFKTLLSRKILPYKKEDGQLFIATAQAATEGLQNDLTFVTGLKVIFYLSELEAIESHLFALLDKGLEGEQLLPRPVFWVEETDYEDENDARLIVNHLILKALNQRASDIHIENYAKNMAIKFRIDGFLLPVWSLPKSLHSQVVNRLKIMSSLDITEKRLPQDGHMRICYRDEELDVRVSTLPLIFGEKVVLRILDINQQKASLPELGFSEKNLAILQDLIERPFGIILITGPTGSGKTTTLYGILNALKGRGKNIMTIEDPVEYEVAGVNQLQVNQKIGMTFARGLRGILRQDPDIIMIGEIRDFETAEIAVRAANTGHLVLASLHTNDAFGAVSRLVEMGVADFLVVNAMLGVVAQRLVRKNCPHCLMDYTYDGEKLVAPLSAKRGGGCAKCNNLGYQGRLALQEILVLQQEQRKAIIGGVSLDEMRLSAKKKGFVSLQEDGFLKIAQGLTTVEEVLLASLVE